MRNDDDLRASFPHHGCAQPQQLRGIYIYQQPPPSTSTSNNSSKDRQTLPCATQHFANIASKILCVIAVCAYSNHYILQFVPSTFVIVVSMSIYSLPFAPSICFVQTAFKQQQIYSSPSYSYQSGTTPTYREYTES